MNGIKIALVGVEPTPQLLPHEAARVRPLCYNLCPTCTAICSHDCCWIGARQIKNLICMLIFFDIKSISMNADADADEIFPFFLRKIARAFDT